MFNKIKFSSFLFLYVTAQVFFLFAQSSYAQNNTVELNGDVLNYSVDGNTITAEGNVVVYRGDTTMSCDSVEFSQDTNTARADGNVKLIMPQGRIEGKNLVFNFDTMLGDFQDAKIYSYPYYGFAETIGKVKENEIRMLNGYITTSDYDKPEYRLTSKKIEISPGDKMVARNVIWYFGKFPVLYIPKFVQSMKDKKPRFIFTPGYDKEWGMFVLTQWRYYLSDDFKGTIHLDAREKKDIASGIDLVYDTQDYGKGVVYTYYMNERNITSSRFYQKRPSPTIERERFKVNWRHNWKIDDKTNAIMQYYKISDATLLKDYFEREYEKDSNPQTYFLLTRKLPSANLSFRTDIRVNRFTSQVERLPEINYSYSSQRIGDTNFYFTDTSTFSNLTHKTASPSEIRQKTERFYSKNRLSYQKKIGIFEVHPYVGGSHTYYSRTKVEDKNGIVRAAFNTGASLSTKFYRIFDAHYQKYGIEINKLRHVITPSINYGYAHEPTALTKELDQYDSIDSLTRSHSLNFLLENKLQTKRKGNTVDLVRFSTETDFRLKEDTKPGGFGLITNDIQVKPNDLITFRADSIYNTRTDRMSTANCDLYVNSNDGKWQWNFGKRWNREADDQITSEFFWRINPIWAFRFYERFDLDAGSQKEQSFTVSRDLHSWVLDLSFTEKRGEGSEILLIFTLKAFPDIGFDFGSSFNKRKTGSQSN